MFEFFTTIFNKAISAVASIIITVGLVSAPVLLKPASVVDTIPESSQSIMKPIEEDNYRKAEIEKLRLKAEKAKQEVEAAKARTEAERLLKEDGARKVAEKQRQLELQQQQRSEEQARQLELQRQDEAQRFLEEQRQREKARTNQINNQIQTLLSEYNEMIAAIDRQILEIEQKYYENAKMVRSQPIAMTFIDGQIQKLARDTDSKINQLELEKERLRLEYQGRIRELERQL